MDFGSLLHVAKKNEVVKKEVKYYSTKFEPPKKEQKKQSQLSINIQKFLAKKEEEERQKALEAKRKRDELLAKRDPKLKKKILKHLKVCKSANKSVLEDAIDHVNTAVTIQGCDQPDQDDYGYVSQEASAFYSKMMEKYSNTPEEKKFPDRHKRIDNDLMSTKDRVRAALEREKEESLLPHKRHRRTKAELSHENGGDPNSELNFNRFMSHSPTNDHDRRTESKPKPKRPPMPPPLDFNELLKIAEQKQLEPSKFEPKIEKKQEKEPERLMTSKEKKEFEEMMARKEGRRQRDLERQQAFHNRSNSHKSSDKNRLDDSEKKSLSKSNDESHATKSKTIVSNPSGRIPKLNGYKPKPESDNRSTSTHPPASKQLNASKESYIKSKSSTDCDRNIMQKHSATYTKNLVRNGLNDENKSMKKSNNSNNDIRNGIRQIPNKQKVVERVPTKSPDASAKDKQRLTMAKEGRSQSSQNINMKSKMDTKERQLPPQDGKAGRQFPPKDVKSTRQFPPPDVKTTRQFPPSDIKTTRQFPPNNDVKPTRQFPPKDVRNQRPADRGMTSKHRKPVNKRRILDDDSEYDSELDDFIDDGPGEGDDYSKYIKDIFGYDKSRYRDEDYDDANMESNFAQVMREEYISKKIGIMEDLEDMKMEAREKEIKSKKKRLK